MATAWKWDYVSRTKGVIVDSEGFTVIKTALPIETVKAIVAAHNKAFQEAREA